MVWMLVALVIACFLLGSIPFGLIISKLFFKKDIRDEGSGNIGTTNAMRTIGKAGGAAVFVLDFSKGLLAGFLGYIVLGLLSESASAADIVVAGSGLPLALAFTSSVCGHIFSPWLKFKGGKGIATAVGCLFFTFGPAGACFELAIFIVLVLLTRYVSIGSIAAAVACPFVAMFFFWGFWPTIIVITLGDIAIIWAHRGNIKRLAEGQENRIGHKKNARS